MPQVPRYERQVEETAIPTVTRPTDAPLEFFGGGAAFEKAGNATQDLLETVSNIAIREKQKADELAVQDADFKLARSQSAWEQSTAKMLGKEAGGAPDITQSGWGKDIKEIEQGLTNQEQKDMIRAKIEARSIQLNDYVQKHVSSEITRYDKEATEGHIANSQMDASRNAYDPERIKASLMQQVQAVNQHAARTGMAPELEKAKIQDVYQKTNLGVIDRMIADENFDLAQSALSASKNLFTGDEQRELQNLIEAGRKKKEAREVEEKDDFYKSLFIRTLPGEKDPLRYSELIGYAREGEVEPTEFESLKNRLFRINDDQTIPRDDKTAKLLDVSTAFQKLNGPKFFGGAPGVGKKTLLPEERTKGNRTDDLRSFRALVTDAAPYLTKEQEKAFLLATERDLTESMTAKAGIIKSLVDSLRFLKISNMTPYLTGALSTLSGGSTPQQTLEAANKARESAVVATNPKATRFKIGDIKTNVNGVSFMVKQFDANGNPMWERVK